MKEATRVFTNGYILTMDAAGTVAQALALDDNIVLAVGTDAEIRRYVGERTECVDLQGQTVLPGFYDSHGHFFMYAEAFSLNVDCNSPPIGSCKDIKDVFKRLKEAASKAPEGEWIQAYGYDDTQIAEKRFVNRHDLDSVSTRHPIYVKHISGHLAVGNSLALQLAGVSAETEDPEGGVIRREADGRQPEGVLEESALHFFRTVIGPYSDAQRKSAMEELSLYYASQGTTTAMDAALYKPDDLILLQELVAEKRMVTRLLFNPYVVRGELTQTIAVSGDMISEGGIKIVHDGSIQGFTAYLSKPYYTPFKGDAAWRGYPFTGRDKLIEMVESFHCAGRQCVVHTNGDAATDDAIAAFESAQKKHPRKDARHLLIHAQTIREEQLDRLAVLGVLPSFFTLHVYYWGDRHNTIFLGPERTERLDPMASALRRGIVSTAHCDAPVTPYRPLLSIQICVTRRSSSGKVYGADQSISVMEALRAHTINAAYQNFEEKSKGSLEPGKLADLVILQQNPLECPVEAIKDIPITATVLGGKTVYTRR